MQAEAEKLGDTLSAQTHMELEALLSGALILDWGNSPLICVQELKEGSRFFKTRKPLTASWLNCFSSYLAAFFSASRSLADPLLLTFFSTIIWTGVTALS